MDILLGKLDNRHSCINISGMRRPTGSPRPREGLKLQPERLPRPEINLVCLLFLSPTCASVCENLGAASKARCSLWPANAVEPPALRNQTYWSLAPRAPIRRRAGTFLAVGLLPRGITDSPGGSKLPRGLELSSLQLSMEPYLQICILGCWCFSGRVKMGTW